MLTGMISVFQNNGLVSNLNGYIDVAERAMNLLKHGSSSWLC